MTSEIPLQVQRLKRSNALRLTYSEAVHHPNPIELPAEYLRVHSPSAEVRQHGKPVLVPAQAEVQLNAVEIVGRYGLKLTFSDGHDSGLYRWDYLLELSIHQATYWNTYLQALHNANLSRFPNQQVVQIQNPPNQPDAIIY